ncbi:indolepyruvate ferredoxin oxidoreductase subunit alpha [Archaeoglobus veneficus]|uniref:Indolepyruvate oxidoreductase subunit IorA n=1 Tax=Archaeoglobus veneficus (strain DSM 11195 / SNP6) TaxID=693661 RepID=F2KTB0_ARCVS|nr:indolepyruvate ferredoxin oxidoreductase subunit alpha [Archaeoglobus veneficus]AEA47140.1 indolepyruvate ferredoxin oxidoreductase, alpha subunit [Archaeoglobus veneficus SNP6]
MLKDVLKESGRVFLLGNEAIARGALEAGIDVFAAYPGTPSSEIGDTLSKACEMLKGKLDFVMEYSANEKVAVEVAMAASLAGKRSMAAMKHVGVNVAADTLFSFAYIGARGGFVLVTADDPSMHSSQNEQDNRWYGKTANLPVIEPSSVQEAKDFARFCFELSERFNIPVILRTYTRLSHASSVVELSPLPEKSFEKVEWKKNPQRDVILPAHARRLKIELLDKMEKIRKYFSRWDGNWIEDGEGNIGVIACGLSYAYAKEAMERLGVNLPVLKLSSMYPVPDELIEEFASQLDGVIIVEEVDPFIELHVRAILPGLKVYGKTNGFFPMSYEYNVAVVEKGIAKALGIKPSMDYDAILERGRELASLAPPRPPVFCPGCPHAATFYAIRKVVNAAGNAALPGDIGCYTLGINRPFEGVDTCVCMGASVGIACGLSYVIKDPIIATIGDSTFFHAGLPALVNAVHNGRKFVLVVLDNSTTGMTGHQPHPGVSSAGCGIEGKAVSIEDVARGMGVEFVEVVNSYNIGKLVETLEKALKHDGVAVVVSRQKCAILRRRELKAKGKKVRPFTVTDDCNLCMKCVTEFACPALYVINGKPVIDAALCIACGVCSRICPEKAIKPAK